MIKPVILTPVAETDLEQLTDYLFSNWSLDVLESFLNRFEEVCTFIASEPQIYPYLNKPEGIRRCLLTKHNIILFKENADAIYILKIFDTRQHPSKLNS